MKQLDPKANAALRTNGTKCVFVACKLPNGLLLEIGATGTDKYQWIRLKGSRATAMKVAAVTVVPEDFWNIWLKGDRKMDLNGHEWLQSVRDGFITAHPTMEHAVASAQMNAAQLTGFEPLKGHDMPKNGDGEPAIEVDAEHLKKLGLAPSRMSA